MFCDDHDLQVAGISLTLFDGSQVRIWIRLACKASDEAALKQFWQCIGAGGLKPCMLCVNCVEHNGKLHKDKNAEAGPDPVCDFDSTGALTSHTHPDMDAFVPQTKASIMQVLEHLSTNKPVVTKTRLEELEKLHGWKDPYRGNILFDAMLHEMMDPTEQTCFDWAHCYGAHGIFNRQVNALMDVLNESGISAVTIDGYMNQFIWPRRLEGKSATGKGAFAPKRAKSSHEAKSFNASISECLSVYPVLANFLFRVCVPVLQQAGDERSLHACAAYFAVCEVLDLLTHAGDARVTPEILTHAIQVHTKLLVDVHGPSVAPPKVHFALHMGGFLRKFGVLPNCVVHERKHKVVKRYLQDRVKRKVMVISIPRYTVL